MPTFGLYPPAPSSPTSPSSLAYACTTTGSQVTGGSYWQPASTASPSLAGGCNNYHQWPCAAPLPPGSGLESPYHPYPRIMPFPPPLIDSALSVAPPDLLTHGNTFHDLSLNSPNPSLPSSLLPLGSTVPCYLPKSPPLSALPTSSPDLPPLSSTATPLSPPSPVAPHSSLLPPYLPFSFPVHSDSSFKDGPPDVIKPSDHFSDGALFFTTLYPSYTPALNYAHMNMSPATTSASLVGSCLDPSPELMMPLGSSSLHLPYVVPQYLPPLSFPLSPHHAPPNALPHSADASSHGLPWFATPFPMGPMAGEGGGAFQYVHADNKDTRKPETEYVTKTSPSLEDHLQNYVATSAEEKRWEYYVLGNPAATAAKAWVRCPHSRLSNTQTPCVHTGEPDMQPGSWDIKDLSAVEDAYKKESTPTPVPQGHNTPSLKWAASAFAEMLASSGGDSPQDPITAPVSEGVCSNIGLFSPPLFHRGVPSSQHRSAGESNDVNVEHGYSQNWFGFSAYEEDPFVPEVPDAQWKAEWFGRSVAGASQYGILGLSGCENVFGQEFVDAKKNTQWSGKSGVGGDVPVDASSRPVDRSKRNGPNVSKKTKAWYAKENKMKSLVSNEKNSYNHQATKEKRSDQGLPANMGLTRELKGVCIVLPETASRSSAGQPTEDTLLKDQVRQIAQDPPGDCEEVVIKVAEVNSSSLKTSLFCQSPNSQLKTDIGGKKISCVPECSPGQEIESTKVPTMARSETVGSYSSQVPFFMTQEPTLESPSAKSHPMYLGASSFIDSIMSGRGSWQEGSFSKGGGHWNSTGWNFMGRDMSVPKECSDSSYSHDEIYAQSQEPSLPCQPKECAKCLARDLTYTTCRPSSGEISACDGVLSAAATESISIFPDGISSPLKPFDSFSSTFADKEFSSFPPELFTSGRLQRSSTNVESYLKKADLGAPGFGSLVASVQNLSRVLLLCHSTSSSLLMAKQIDPLQHAIRNISECLLLEASAMGIHSHHVLTPPSNLPQPQNEQASRTTQNVGIGDDSFETISRSSTVVPGAMYLEKKGGLPSTNKEDDLPSTKKTEMLSEVKHLLSSKLVSKEHVSPKSGQNLPNAMTPSKDGYHALAGEEIKPNQARQEIHFDVLEASPCDEMEHLQLELRSKEANIARLKFQALKNAILKVRTTEEKVAEAEKRRKAELLIENLRDELELEREENKGAIHLYKVMLNEAKEAAAKATWEAERIKLELASRQSKVAGSVTAMIGSMEESKKVEARAAVIKARKNWNAGIERGDVISFSSDDDDVGLHVKYPGFTTASSATSAYNVPGHTVRPNLERDNDMSDEKGMVVMRAAMIRARQVLSKDTGAADGKEVDELESGGENSGSDSSERSTMSGHRAGDEGSELGSRVKSLNAKESKEVQGGGEMPASDDESGWEHVPSII